jgi:hypothetical protein
MRHPLVYLVGTLVVVAIATTNALGQYYQQQRPPGYASPAVSPYVNLVQRGTSPGIQYYGIVRPTINLQNSVTGLQQGLTTTNAQLTATDQALTTGLPETGHNVAFMNYSHYFGGAAGVTGSGLARGTSQTGTAGRGTGRSTGYTPSTGSSPSTGTTR